MGLSNVEEFNLNRELVQYQRRKVSSRIQQFIRDYANSVTLMVLGFIVLIAAGFWFGIVKHPEPHSLVSKYGVIIAYNKYNFELFRVRYDATSEHVSHSPKNAIIADVNSDDKAEILIGSTNYSNNGFESTLACYNRKGEVIWIYEIRPKTKFGDNTYFGTYNIERVFCDDLNSDGQMEIVCTAGHINFPQVIYTLNAKGEKIAEYWNSGHWTDFTIDEVYSENNTKEIITAGCDNETNQAILTVLDPFKMDGASPQKELYYQKIDANKGIEIFRLRFPKTHFSSKLHCDTVQKISINNKVISIELYNTIDHLANPGRNKIYIQLENMTPVFCDLSSFYYSTYSKYYPEKKPLIYNDPELINYFKRVEYWDGEQWVLKKVKNAHYQF